MKFLHRFLRADRGATAIEYAVVAAVLGGAIVIGARDIGGALNVILANVATRFK